MSLLVKTEQAMVDVVKSLGIAGLTVNRGMSEDELVAPYVVCFAESVGDEEIADSSIFHINCEVRVVTQPDDSPTSLSDQRELVEKVFGVFNNPATESDLSEAVLGFYCYQVDFQGQESNPSEDRKWENTLTLDLLCCETDIS